MLNDVFLFPGWFSSGPILVQTILNQSHLREYPSHRSIEWLSSICVLFLEVVVQTTTYIQFAFVVLHSWGGSWELVDAFSLCCLTWHFWKILGE